MTTSEIREVLQPYSSTFSVRKGIYTMKKSYYWGLTKSGEVLKNTVESLIPNAKVIDYGNHYADFHGGARPGTSQDSYFWVRFTGEN